MWDHQRLGGTCTPRVDPDTSKNPFLTTDTNIFGVRKHIIERILRCRHVHRFATRALYIYCTMCTDSIALYNGETI